MAARPTTPPPSLVVNPPPTPRLGFEDNWTPYPPRKSARLSSQRLRRAAQTPPLELSNQTSPKSATIGIATPTSSSKHTTKSPIYTKGRRVSGALTSADTTSAAMELGLHKKGDKTDSLLSLTTRNGMLPTPAKTPKKRPTEENSRISTIARNIFPVRPDSVDELMPSPKKKGRKSYTLGSFSTEEDELDSIHIYTDSNERIPEVDLDPDNPFYGEAAAAAPAPKRLSRRRTVTIPGEGELTLEEAEKREDGMVYVFRGKKMFCKFTDDGDPQSIGEASDAVLNAELDSTVPARLRGPLTRSSIKPRLLFPTPEQLAAKAQKSQIVHDEEEAVTDIEDSKISTPVAQFDKSSSPPGAPKFGHLSPPTTTQATRSTKRVGKGKTESARPLTPTMSTDERSATESISPFDGWKRTRASTSAHSKKRGGDMISRGGGEISKRPRAGRNQPA